MKGIRLIIETNIVTLLIGLLLTATAAGEWTQFKQSLFVPQGIYLGLAWRHYTWPFQLPRKRFRNYDFKSKNVKFYILDIKTLKLKMNLATGKSKKKMRNMI